MMTALALAAVVSATALADDPAAGWPPPPPAVAGVDVGDATFLNAREWKFAAFFNQVKQKVAEVWDPMVAARVRDRAGNIYFNKDRTTVLSVTLDLLGTITEIKVARSSGLDFLDQLAVDAIWQVKAFKDPPRQKTGPEGGIRFPVRFELSGSPSADWARMEVFLE